MPKLEFYFDLACPFCLKGHDYLKAIIGNYTNIEIEWLPVEAHPRPEKHGRHSDLCLRGMYIALDAGVDVWDYCERAYEACLKDRIDIEDADVLAGYFSGLMDRDAFAEAIKTGGHADCPDRNNDRAYRDNGVWAVPSFRMDGHKLDSIEGVGITPEQLKSFLDLAK